MPHLFPRNLFPLLALLAASAAPIAALAQDQGAIEASNSESFASTFFVSKATHADGTVSIDIVGSLLLWLLLGLSVVNIGLIGYLALVNQRKSIAPKGLVNEVRKLVTAGDFRRAIEMTRQDESHFSRVVHAGLMQANHGLNAVVRASEQAADVLLSARMRPIEFLYMLGQVSPMIGLLGTVYGIIFAFRVFVTMGGHASPSLLAGGIGTALVATFWGLIVAIPALAGYSVLRGKVDALTLEASVAMEEIFSQLRPKAPAAGSKPAPPPPAPAPMAKPHPIGQPSGAVDPHQAGPTPPASA